MVINRVRVLGNGPPTPGVLLVTKDAPCVLVTVEKYMPYSSPVK